mmetsp:Transcript_4838/g.10389  ORF Transcript_4838/g.10389 Transcript_4838/m.10389 type:complete len:497 (+) Transcript_4838:49-1539(+)
MHMLSQRSARALHAPAQSGRHPHSSRRVVRHRSARTPLKVNAIGFDFGDNEAEVASPVAEKKTKLSTINTLASSLLVFGPVLKGAVGEAFLAAMAITNKYQAANKDVLAAFGKFYNLLLTAGYDSWEDYLLDQILLGRDNAFARAVAQGNVEAGSPILKAVAYDLDVLQQICLPMSRLAEYIGDAAPIAGPYWVEAASSVSTKAPKKALSGGASSPQIAMNMNMPSKYIGRPPTPDELREWRAAIQNKAEWSEAVPVLQQYYHLHGFGITSRNTALRWNKGAFEEGSEGGPGSSKVLSVLEQQQQTLAANTLRFCEGLPAHHVLVAGPSGSGKSWLLWESTLVAAKERGIRIVEVSASDLSGLLDVARGAGRYPRLRFIIVADNVNLPLSGTLASDLMSALPGGTGPAGWPSNTLLYMGANPNSTITYDPVVSRFGLVLTTGFLSEAEFGKAISELADPAQGAGVPAAALEKAVAWAKQRGGLTVGNAVRYMAQQQ